MSAYTAADLRFLDSGQWHSLPHWIKFFYSVGEQIAIADKVASRVVTAIAVPTRAYCAAFVSLGMVIRDAAWKESSSAAVHFEKLFDLPIGTPVIFRQDCSKVLRGVLQNPEEISGKLYVRVRVHSWDARTGGGLTYLIDESRSLQVQPAIHSGRLPKKQGGQNRRFANSFVDSLLGDTDPVQLGLRSKIVCALVGKKSSLEHEILHTTLAVHANGDSHAEGKLQDLLRVDRFISGEQRHRSTLVPVSSRRPSDDATSQVQMGVVFDGAAGFLKWGKLWPGHHQIIILDRTDMYFNDAITAINSRISQNRADGETHLPTNEAVPPGCEIIAFREAIQ